VAASDALIYGNIMATYWVLTILNNNTREIGGVHSISWEEGMIPADEGLGILDLVEIIIWKIA